MQFGLMLIVVLVLCGQHAGAQQRQSTPEQRQNQPGQHEIIPDNCGTDQIPLVVKELPRERTVDEIKEAQTKANLDRQLTEYTGNLAAYTERLFIATLMLAALTGSLAVAAFLQMRDSRKSATAAVSAARTAERALTAVERAFVAVRDLAVFTITYNNSQVAAFIIHVFVVNSGRTPARSYISNVNVVILDKIPTDFRFPDRTLKTERSVLSNQTQTYIRTELAIQDAVAIFEKTKEGLMYGWLEYDDIFDNNPRRRTEFCMKIETPYGDPRILRPQIPGQQPPPVLAFPVWGEYNATDGDCRYQPGETPVALIHELPAITQPPPNPYLAQPQESLAQRAP